MAHILVIDDEPHITDVVSAYLAREGHHVETAADGDTAFELARSTRPDLLVLDVGLPGRSGFDVLRDLRAEGVDSAVIMLTARGQEIDKVLGLKIGADDYVTKPFGFLELMALGEAERVHGALVVPTAEVKQRLVEAGVARVVAAMQDPNPLVAGQGLERLRAAGIRAEPGLLEARRRDRHGDRESAGGNW